MYELTRNCSSIFPPMFFPVVRKSRKLNSINAPLHINISDTNHRGGNCSATSSACSRFFSTDPACRLAARSFRWTSVRLRLVRAAAMVGSNQTNKVNTQSNKENSCHKVLERWTPLVGWRRLAGVETFLHRLAYFLQATPCTPPLNQSLKHQTNIGRPAIYNTSIPYRNMLQRLVLLALLVLAAKAFSPARRLAGSRLSYKQELRAGFGGAAATAKRKSRKAKKGSSFDVKKSVLRLEKLYDKITLQHDKNLNTEDEEQLFLTEYVVAIKALHYDWVPVAQICLSRPHEATDTLTAAVVSRYCRELSYVAGLGSNVFQSMARDQFQYAVESSDSFHKYVYEPLEKHADDLPMSKEQARDILDIRNGESVKQQYRLQSKKYHPDRFVNTDQSQDEVAEAALKYEQIQHAYEVLRNGVGESWYESLGGRARTDFVKLKKLVSIDAATKQLQASQIESAVVGLDPELVQGFVARSRQ